MNERIASAVFDSREEAERALNELRSSGVDEDLISIIGRHGEQSDASGGINDDGDAAETAGDTTKGALGGAVAGGLLGVAALAISASARLPLPAQSPRQRSPALRRSAPAPARLRAVWPAFSPTTA